MSVGRIAVVIPGVYDILDREFLSGIHNAAKAIGYDTLVFTGVSAENDKKYTDGENNIYELVFSVDIDGVIIAANRFGDKELKKKLLKRLDNAGIACVAIEEEYKGIEGIFPDQHQSIREITGHLINKHGYRDILCLTGPQGNRIAENRAAGYIRAMKKSGLGTSVIYGDFWRNSAAQFAKDIAEGKRSRPEAVVCTSDIMAVTLCEKLTEYGVKVPEDIAVTGYDGSIYALLTRPAVTTVCGGEKSLGMLAMKTLAKKMGVKCDVDCNKHHVRICGSCGCHNPEEEKEHLLRYTELIVRRQLERKTFMYSNYIAKMSDCESVPKFATVLDSLRYMLPECSTINVCVCEDWRVEHPECRKSGYSENMQLIYSEDQPGQLDFPLRNLLPCLNTSHEPQFWVFSSIHYSDRIIGYMATLYEKAENFVADEHYTGWCDAVANGLDIVIKKSNTEYIWQKLEEKNMADIYTGLRSRRGFVSDINSGDNILLFSFPKRYMNIPYFVPIVSAVLRSDNDIGAAVYLGETTFGVSLKKSSIDGFAERLCRAIAELGIYAADSEIDIVIDEMTSTVNADERITEMQLSLSEKNTPRSNEIYSEVFSNLRKEMKYSPQNNWCISEAAIRTGLSTSHFQRLYKKYFNVSFTEELIAFRMERAKYLLKNTSMSVQRVSEECGYTNAAHFMRQFREREKMSAGQYRKAEKND